MTDLVKTGLWLIFIGSALVFAGTILSSRNVGFGGLIMIGPIPIAFGTSWEITLIAMVIGLFLVIAHFLLGRKNA